MTEKVITREFVVPTLLAIVLGIAPLDRRCPFDEPLF
jgi:hypothetical protein